jgi:hypothetical protein
MINIHRGSPDYNYMHVRQSQECSIVVVKVRSVTLTSDIEA